MMVIRLFTSAEYPGIDARCAYHHSRPQEYVSTQHFSHPGYAHVIYSYAPAALPFRGDEASADIFLADGDRPPREGQEPRGRTFHVTV